MCICINTEYWPEYSFNNQVLIKNNLQQKLRIFGTVILNTKCMQIPQKLVHEKFYVHEITAVDLSKFTSWKTQRKLINQTNAI